MTPQASGQSSQVIGIIAQLVDEGLPPAAVAYWMRQPQRELSNLSPKAWLNAGGSERRILAMAKAQTARIEESEIPEVPTP